MGFFYSLFIIATALYCGSVTYSYAFEVVFAVNCGGDAHRDIMGIEYKKDTLKVGTKSDFGKQLMIGRVSPEDQILYQTERYHVHSFGYDVRIPGDGKYVLIAKFAEVYFMSPGAKTNLGRLKIDIRLCTDVILAPQYIVFKLATITFSKMTGNGLALWFVDFLNDPTTCLLLVAMTMLEKPFVIVTASECHQATIIHVFDVQLNNEHVVIRNLDIFSKVGKSMAHDEYVSFTINDGMLEVQGEKSPFHGTLSIEFLKGAADNPKVNAIVVIRGSVDEITKLPPLPRMESEEDMDDYESEKASRKFQRTSGPRTKDPYASDDSWFMPITIAIALFLPILFCLCRH